MVLATVADGADLITTQSAWRPDCGPALDETA